MERKKSIFACVFISAAMIFLTLSAYATSVDSSADAGNQSSVVQVVLPTSDYKFTIDPYGLTTMDGAGKSLEEVMANPPGLVTSDALEIKNTNTDTGIQIDVVLYLSSNSPIKVAKTRAEAESGTADLYLEIKPTGGSADWAPTPVTVIGDGSSQGNQLSFHLEKGGENDTYTYVIDGYANPNAEIWKSMASAQDTVNLNMKFSFKPDEAEETSSETESSSEEPSSEEASSEDSSSEETSSDEGEETSSSGDIQKPTQNVDAFSFSVKKSDLYVSAVPTYIIVTYDSRESDLSMYAAIDRSETDEEYIFDITDNTLFVSGDCKVQILSSNRTILYETTISFPAVSMLPD